jgi:hypothetical protein
MTGKIREIYIRTIQVSIHVRSLLEIRNERRINSIFLEPPNLDICCHDYIYICSHDDSHAALMDTCRYLLPPRERMMKL